MTTEGTPPTEYRAYVATTRAGAGNHTQRSLVILFGYPGGDELGELALAHGERIWVAYGESVEVELAAGRLSEESVEQLVAAVEWEGTQT